MSGLVSSLLFFPSYANSLIRTCRAQSEKRNDRKTITRSLTTDKPRQRIGDPCAPMPRPCPWPGDHSDGASPVDPLRPMSSTEKMWRIFPSAWLAKQPAPKGGVYAVDRRGRQTREVQTRFSSMILGRRKATRSDC